MKEKIDKLIQSNNTDDWLIAYELIIKEYKDLRNYTKGKNYLYLAGFKNKNLCRARRIVNGKWTYEFGMVLP